MSPAASVRRANQTECCLQYDCSTRIPLSALAAAGLPSAFGMHCLRHTYASGLIAAGLHPRVVMARLGHASIEETMNTYGHLFPDSVEQTADALERLFGS